MTIDPRLADLWAEAMREWIAEGRPTPPELKQFNEVMRQAGEHCARKFTEAVAHAIAGIESQP